MATALQQNANALAQILMQRRQQQMQETENAKQNQLRDLQFQRQGQMDNLQMQELQAQSADRQAKQGALRDLYKVGTDQEAYRAQLESQKDNEWTTNLIGNIDKFKKMGATPEFLTTYAKEQMGANPKYAGFAQHLTFLDDKAVELTRDFKDGELRDPMNPQTFLPAGKYKVKGIRTADPANPFDFNSIEPIEPKPDQEALIDKRFENQRQLTQMQIDAQDRRAAADRAAADKRATGKGVERGKLTAGYRWAADGVTMEPIPGGPADQSIEKAKGAYDTSIAVVDKLLAHPGRKMATGKTSLNPFNLVPGTQAYDFNRELESFDANLFLSNIEKMKGMGALSNAEGAKVSAAAGAIKPGMSEKAFEQNLNIIKTELAKAKQRLDNGGKLPPPKPAPAPGPKLSPKAQAIADKY